MNGDSKHAVAYITLGIAVVGLAFWVGTQAAQIIALQTEIALTSPVKNDHRITALEIEMDEVQKHLEANDRRTNTLEERQRR